MTGNVSLWSKTDVTNESVDPAINFSEGQLPGTVNNSARAVMSGVASWRDDVNGTLTTGGTANAQTVTTNTGYTALTTGIVLGFKAGATNTGNTTLTVTPFGGAAFTAQSVLYCAPTGTVELLPGMLTIGGHYLVRYNGTVGAWILLNPSNALHVHGADVASNSTINLDTATGDLVNITGTTTITAITLGDGIERTVLFTGSLLLSHGASLVLPGSNNITTQIGDVAIFRGYTGSTVRCTFYQPYNGFPNNRLATMADQTVKGNVSGGVAVPSDLTVAQLVTLIRTGTAATNVLKVKGISFTRDMTASSGNVAYTGVGFKPTAILFMGFTVAASPQFFVGMSDAAGSGFDVATYDTAKVGQSVGTPVLLYDTDGTATKYQLATINSYDTDGFTLAWQKGGTPGANTANVHAICFR